MVIILVLQDFPLQENLHLALRGLNDPPPRVRAVRFGVVLVVHSTVLSKVLQAL